MLPPSYENKADRPEENKLDIDDIVGMMNRPPIMILSAKMLQEVCKSIHSEESDSEAHPYPKFEISDADRKRWDREREMEALMSKKDSKTGDFSVNHGFKFDLSAHLSIGVELGKTEVDDELVRQPRVSIRVSQHWESCEALMTVDEAKEALSALSNAIKLLEEVEAEVSNL